MWILLLWMGGLIALVAAFATGYWWTTLFWIELQFMQLESDDWHSQAVE